MGMVSRRGTMLRALALGLASGGLSPAAEAAAPLLEPGSTTLQDLMVRLDAIPRRRDFDRVPMILTKPDQWDAAAIKAVLTARADQRQVWNNFELTGYWLTVMRNALNTQIWGYDHPNFLVVSATHGSAGFALYDQPTWDKYKIGTLFEAKNGDRYKTNTLIVERGSGGSADFEDPDGLFSSTEDSIPTLQRRGVVFMACHNAIWEHAAILIRHDQNPDKLDQGAIAADLTNHLIPGTILTPGIVGTLPELQKAGFFYAAI